MWVGHVACGALNVVRQQEGGHRLAHEPVKPRARTNSARIINHHQQQHPQSPATNDTSSQPRARAHTLSSGMNTVSARLGLESVACSLRPSTIWRPYLVLGVSPSAARNVGYVAETTAARAARAAAV